MIGAQNQTPNAQRPMRRKMKRVGRATKNVSCESSSERVRATSEFQLRANAKRLTFTEENEGSKDRMIKRNLSCLCYLL